MLILPCVEKNPLRSLWVNYFNSFQIFLLVALGTLFLAKGSSQDESQLVPGQSAPGDVLILDVSKVGSRLSDGRIRAR